MKQHDSLKRGDVLKILAAHKDEWFSKYGLTKLGVFGSIARDEAQSTSDVDVVIQMSRLDTFLLVALREEMVDALGADVDLVTDHDYLRPFFKQRLSREAIYV